MSTKRLGFLTMSIVVLALGSILFAACTRPGILPLQETPEIHQRQKLVAGEQRCT